MLGRAWWWPVWEKYSNAKAATARPHQIKVSFSSGLMRGHVYLYVCVRVCLCVCVHDHEGALGLRAPRVTCFALLLVCPPLPVYGFPSFDRCAGPAIDEACGTGWVLRRSLEERLAQVTQQQVAEMGPSGCFEHLCSWCHPGSKSRGDGMCPKEICCAV